MCWNFTPNRTMLPNQWFAWMKKANRMGLEEATAFLARVQFHYIDRLGLDNLATGQGQILCNVSLFPRSKASGT